MKGGGGGGTPTQLPWQLLLGGFGGMLPQETFTDFESVQDNLRPFLT